MKKEKFKKVLEMESIEVIFRDDINEILSILTRAAANRKARYGFFYNRQELEEMKANIQLDIVEQTAENPDKPFCEVARKAQNRASINSARAIERASKHQESIEKEDFSILEKVGENGNIDDTLLKIAIEEYMEKASPKETAIARLILDGCKPYIAAEKLGHNKADGYKVARELKKIIAE